VCGEKCVEMDKSVKKNAATTIQQLTEMTSKMNQSSSGKRSPSNSRDYGLMNNIRKSTHRRPKQAAINRDYGILTKQELPRNMKTRRRAGRPKVSNINNDYGIMSSQEMPNFMKPRHRNRRHKQANNNRDYGARSSQKMPNSRKPHGRTRRRKLSNNKRDHRIMNVRERSKKTKARRRKPKASTNNRDYGLMNTPQMTHFMKTWSWSPQSSPRNRDYEFKNKAESWMVPGVKYYTELYDPRKKGNKPNGPSYIMRPIGQNDFPSFDSNFLPNVDNNPFQMHGPKPCQHKNHPLLSKDNNPGYFTRPMGPNSFPSYDTNPQPNDNNHPFQSYEPKPAENKKPPTLSKDILENIKKIQETTDKHNPSKWKPG